jgi:hypothetical protein
VGIYNVSAQKLCTFHLGDDGQSNELKASFGTLKMPEFYRYVGSKIESC